MFNLTISLLVGIMGFSNLGFAAGSLKVGDAAPTFSTQTQDVKSFDMKERKGKWTVLYFYPKADTPGCTKQACAYRDSIKKIQNLNAEVFGVSTDSVDDIKKFHTKHRLTFTLLSDLKAEITQAYGVKMPILTMAKRWTFIIDPQLKIRHIDTDVDPVRDSEKMVQVIQGMQ